MSRPYSTEGIKSNAKETFYEERLTQGTVAMDTAKVFEDGGCQVVQIPKKFRFDVDEVMVQKLGDAVFLAPKSSAWNVFIDGLEGFTDGFSGEAETRAFKKNG